MDSNYGPNDAACPIVLDNSDFSVGITKIDYFAALAMQAYITSCDRFSEVKDHKTCAIQAYKMAEAMMTERKAYL